MAECSEFGSLLPCASFLNDVHILHLTPFQRASGEPGGGFVDGDLADENEVECCPDSHWETPLIDGVPPLPRRGHTLTNLREWGGGPFYREGYDGGEDPALLVLFGQGVLHNATTRQDKGLYFNDMHILHLGNRSWYPCARRARRRHRAATTARRSA